MTTSQSVKTQEQSQEWWLSLGHSTARKSWSPRKMSQIPPGSGQIPMWWKAQGRNLCLFRGKTRAWLDFFWQGQDSSLCMLSVQYLHISAQLIAERLWVAERGQFVWPMAVVESRHPKGETPITPSWPQGRLEMPAREQGSRHAPVAFPLHRSFSIQHGQVLQTLCSATCIPGKHEILISSSPLKCGWVMRTGLFFFLETEQKWGWSYR